MDYNQLCISCFKPYGGEEVCMHCGHLQANRPKQLCHLFPRTILKNRYFIGEVINNGGFGVVYKAFDLKLQTKVAIKELLPTQNSIVNRTPGNPNVIPVNDERVKIFENLKQRFLNEARTIAQFNECEPIVHIYDFFEENNTAYLVMEYIEGTTLRNISEDKKDPMPVEEVMRIMIPVMQAVSVMHKQKVIHRDISPDNIMITPDNQVKLIDFGAAVLSENDENNNDSLVLKAGYTPPEQYRTNGKTGVYTDIYALGAVLYKLLTGITPEESIDRAEKDELKKPSQLGITLPIAVEKSIMKAMALRESARFKSVDEFILALQGKKKADYPEKELKKKKMLRTISVALTLVIIASSVLGTYYFKAKNSLIPSSDTTITVWYVEDGTSNKKERFENICADYKSFCKGQNNSLNIKVNAVGKSKDTYEKDLENAIKSGNAPDVYEADELSDNKYAEPLDKLYENIDSENFCAAYSKMEKLLKSHNEIAFCYDMPVLYTYTDNKFAPVPKEDAKIEELKNYKSTNTTQKYGLIVNKNAVLYSAYALGYKNKGDSSIVKELYNNAALFDDNNKPITDSTSEFTDGYCSYYIGFMSEFSHINENVNAGVFSFSVSSLTNTKNDYVFFPETWSINKKSSSANKKAAIFLMYFLANEKEGQKDVTEINRNTYYLPMLLQQAETIKSSYENYEIAYQKDRKIIEEDYQELYNNKVKSQEIADSAITFGKNDKKVDDILNK